jgi:hypothetical protein
VPIAGLLLAALVATFVVCMIVMGKDFTRGGGPHSVDQLALLGGVVPLMMAMNLFAITLPTMALYFLPLLGAWLIITRRSAGAVALFVLALMPFLHWGSARSDAVKEHQREAAEVAAIATKPLPPRLPATLVFESQRTDGLRGVENVPAIEGTVVKWPVNPKSFAQALPDEYLLLRVGPSSGFAKQVETYSAAGGPFELRFVDPSHDDLIAVWYQVFNPGPTAVPLLTLRGWYRGQNIWNGSDVDAKVGEFLTSALKARS